MMGIYKIINKKNNHSYIGSTQDISKRRYMHFRQLKNGRHVNIHLQRAFNKYGLDAFEFIILEECSEELLLTREQYWIDKTKQQGLYNLCPVAGSRRGINLSEQTKKRISETNKGKTYNRIYKPVSEEIKAILKTANLGKKMSDEARQKISDRFKGKPLSIEHRQRLSEKAKQRGISEETRAKMVASRKKNLEKAA